ncbi:hypothetical protein DUZ99_09050 [Xylanibacillus composti]|uniref:Thioredoxin n=1 Tax=Xylanibacillus composti TaxID=1572762 RepID=A0A8J4M191_9BACL|nr:hypothetical protein [Xylanibacillus composti]MDT9725131.1 hypothetical protein [Xylanibacillus composti]GIQ67296.1 hypothetical protein XYCOK13_01200 [Xylanibacillus composti]
MLKDILEKYKPYKTGDRMQDFLIDERTSFHRMVGDGIIVLTISTKCAACLETLNDLQEVDVSKKGLVVFIECDDQEYPTIHSVLSEKFNLIRIDHAFLKKNLKTPGVPWIYRIDEQLQIILNRNYRTKDDLDIRNKVDIYEHD